MKKHGVSVVFGLLLGLAALAVCAAATAQDDGLGQSIMFENDRKYLTEEPAQGDAKWERCR